MKVKRYRAEDRATALKQIRADLGSDAVIVHEHRVRTGGVFGMFGRVEVEILAAVEERPVAARPPAPAPGGPADRWRDASLRTTGSFARPGSTSRGRSPWWRDRFHRFAKPAVSCKSRSDRP
ncbi:MAG: hypothetical protein NTV35_07020 [Chloroflexi bacterium]|nr:hypothetical protein [Chloroflexota bacterium]